MKINFNQQVTGKVKDSTIKVELKLIRIPLYLITFEIDDREIDFNRKITGNYCWSIKYIA